MTRHDDDAARDSPPSANPLAPLFERAARAAEVERPGTSPVRLTLIDDEWLLLSDADADLADHGAWIASDTFETLPDGR